MKAWPRQKLTTGTKKKYLSDWTENDVICALNVNKQNG